MPASPHAARELLDALEDGDVGIGDELEGCTDCPNGCVVEPDGTCPHDYEAAALTLLGIVA